MTGVARFRHKPTVVEAVRWTGGNEEELIRFAGPRVSGVDPEDRGDDPEITAEVFDDLHGSWIGVKTGQWIAKGTKGEYWPIDDEVLRETYDPAGPDAERERASENAITWETSCTSCSAVLDTCLAETSRREGAEQKLAEAVLLLGAIREGAANFLAEYGDGDIPMFKVGQDLANAVLGIIDADAPTDDDENGASHRGDRP